MIFNKVITEEDGKEFRAYVARPPAGQGPGIVLLHEVYGVNDSLKATADKLAAEGFVVYCPNLYWRDDQNASFRPQSPGEEMTEDLKFQRERARELMFEKLDHSKIPDDVEAAVKAVRNDPDCTGKVGCMGSCLGGKGVYLATAKNIVDAGVAFYPTPELRDVFSSSDALASNTPLLFVLGGSDPYISPEEKQKMRGVSGKVIDYVEGLPFPEVRSNDDGNKNITTHYFPASGHAFARVGGKDYDEAVANYVTDVSVSFFNKHLGDGNKPVDEPELRTPESPKYLPKSKK